MPGLGHTTAKLARYRRQWAGFVTKSNAHGGFGGTDAATPLDEVRAFGANPGNLRMLKYVPVSLGRARPLVVVLHGCTQTAGGYDHGTGWSTLAERYGFALLLPEQRRANNPNTCFTWFHPADTTRDRGEALSIRQMVARMVDDHAIDPGRVYVTGLSAGGAMTSVMLATYPEVFAGGAIVAGLPYGGASNVQEAFDAMAQGARRPAATWGALVRAASPHRGPWPKVSVWHGDADATVTVANADAIMSQWADVHGLPVAPTCVDTIDGHRRRVWRDARGEAVLESYTIAGLAHGVPIAPDAGADSLGAAAPYILDAGISSTLRIAQFWGIVSDRGEAAAEARTGAANGAVIDEDGRVLNGAWERPVVNGATAREHVGAAEGERHQERPRRFDPGAIIAKALRAAGLMK